MQRCHLTLRVNIVTAFGGGGEGERGGAYAGKVPTLNTVIFSRYSVSCLEISFLTDRSPVNEFLENIINCGWQTCIHTQTL